MSPEIFSLIKQALFSSFSLQVKTKISDTSFDVESFVIVLISFFLVIINLFIFFYFLENKYYYKLIIY